MTDSLQKYLAELFGTFTLVFIGTTAILATGGGGIGVKNLAIAFGFGLALLAGLYAFAEVSGGHFNPGVSLAMVLDKRLSATDLIPYWIAQFAGAVLASLCVLIAFDQDAVASTATLPGASAPAPPVPRDSCDGDLPGRHPPVSASERHGGTALLAIPLTLCDRARRTDPVQRLIAEHARSFGPALIGNEWSDFWVYLIGPPLGAVLGFVVYAVVSKPQPEVTTQEAKRSA